MASALIARDRLGVAIHTDRSVRAIEARTAMREQQLRVMARAHEVTRPSRSRKLARDWGSGNAIAGMDSR
ncbi:hypothetical protein [Xanthomonas euvesicatoria]|uniref:Septum formation topological specificity factor MinE n=1 Tax=Xanthomonas euvesicatoria TaxID=456327 RepID=A0AAW3U0X0_XANEU|nr:hypothetical protein [Xanthomonas euvesicatoria]MBB4722706.1 septum formation topological specificity factor MinE [Xanthomonas euvesicatoria]MBB4869299.1 septum formation topological specificity factor MinE [Xanthomonas euvesicatoria]